MRGLSGARFDLREAHHDLLAGLTLTAFLVPVGMAYAQAAGLPPVNGLYATIVPLVVYAIIGPSRVLVLGPDSSLAPLIAATVLPLSLGDPERAVWIAGAVAIGAGFISLAAGLAGFGFVTELLSTPARHGYLNGVVGVVLVSQVPLALGIEIDSDDTLGRLGELVSNLVDGQARLAPSLLAAGSFITIVLLRRIAPRVPGVLIAVAGSILAVRLLGLDEQLTLVGSLPSGLPGLGLPEFGVDDLGPIVAGSVTVAVVAVTDTSLLSRSIGVRRGQSVDTDRELVALGAANLAAGLSQGFAVSASSSRTPVAIAAGARTQLSNLVAAAAVALLLIAAPGALQSLPTATLAAVVIAAVWDLVEIRNVTWLLRTRPSEFAFSLIATSGVITLGVLWGVGIAVGFSLLALIQRAWRPYVTTLVRVEGVKGYHDVARHPEGRGVPGLVLFRFDAPLFFANAEFFRREVMASVDTAGRGGGPTRWVVVAAGSITDIDATADQMLVELSSELDDAGVELAFAELRGVVRDRLHASGTVDLIGRERFYPTVGRAVGAYVTESGTEWIDWEDVQADDPDDPDHPDHADDPDDPDDPHHPG